MVQWMLENPLMFSVIFLFTVWEVFNLLHTLALRSRQPEVFADCSELCECEDTGEGLRAKLGDL